VLDWVEVPTDDGSLARLDLVIPLGGLAGARVLVVEADRLGRPGLNPCGWSIVADFVREGDDLRVPVVKHLLLEGQSFPPAAALPEDPRKLALPALVRVSVETSGD
jgi:hypothetical protein